MIYNYIFMGWNILVALIYGIDKFRARKRKRRISEKHLITLAFLMGGFGAVVGMILFNHKTNKNK